MNNQNDHDHDCNDQDRPKVVYMMLGDGDFSFSLDLATWLSQELPETESQRDGPLHQLIVTGVDSQDDILAKYKDSKFVRGQLESVNKKQNVVDVKMVYKVNAVDPGDGVGDIKADYVVFNHPHLGTENADLHFRFLCHLFYTTKNTWLKPGGVLWLTLAAGQFDRWKCHEAAEKQGLVVCHRCDFQPPNTKRSYYHYRRHQTGKSFASRTAGSSETITLTTKSDDGKLGRLKPPWFKSQLSSTVEPMIKCPYCDRSFKEARSAKSHIRAKHEGEKKRKRGRLPCDSCDRDFESPEALQDHIRAKHQANNSTPRPYWCSATVSDADTNKTDTVEPDDSCEICKMTLNGTLDQHMKLFRPMDMDEAEKIASNLFCVICSKRFGDERALLQHKLVCGSK